MTTIQIEKGTFLEELDQTITPARDRLLGHPIWREIEAGILAPAKVTELTIQQYYASADSVRKRMALGLNAPDQETLEELVRYAMGEVGHEELGRRACQAAGVDMEKLLTWDWQAPCVESFNDWAWRLALRGTTAEWAASYNYGLEGVFSPICDSVAKGMQAHYGFSEHDAEFFWIHVEADAEHQSLGATLVQRLATTPDLQRKCKKAALKVLDHLYSQYEFVYTFEGDRR